MNAEDQNQDFEKLQHLLKLKRYEQPPPRYFNDFPGQVVSRIRGRTPGGRFESFDDIVHQTPWLRRVWHAVEGRPAISGMLAAMVCGLMIVAVFISENTTSQRLNVLAVGDGTEPANDLATAAALGDNFAGVPQLVSSTNLGAIKSLFDNVAPNHQPMLIRGTPFLQK
jgi:hypothetical protein